MAVIPVILAVVLTASGPGTIRVPVLVVCAAAYGFALAWAGVRIAVATAQARLPELCQTAVRSATL